MRDKSEEYEVESYDTPSFCQAFLSSSFKKSLHALLSPPQLLPYKLTIKAASSTASTSSGLNSASSSSSNIPPPPPPPPTPSPPPLLPASSSSASSLASSLASSSYELLAEEEEEVIMSQGGFANVFVIEIHLLWVQHSMLLNH